MANFTTVRDLRNDALWIAGEAQTSASSYYARSLAYLNAVLIGLVSGGPLGAVSLVAIDWWWANKPIYGELAIPNAFNTTPGSVTLATTQGSTTITFTGMPGSTSLKDYRISFLDDQDQVMYITAHTAGAATATVQTAWQKTARSATNQFVAWQDFLVLPTDFGRFTTPLKIGRYPYEIELTDAETLERRYPRNRLWLGTPVTAALTHEQSGSGYVTPALRMSHMLQDGPIVAWFEYLAKVTELVDSAGTEEPPMPHQHRRVLSLGAAYLMLFDKVDSKAQTVQRMFMDAWEAMAEEHYRQTSDNENFGRILSRQRDVASRRFPLRSPSGFIYG